MKPFPLPGFAGENPLGFLAAIGLLRTLTEAYPKWQPRLNWAQRGLWRPVLTLSEAISDDELVTAVFTALQGSRKSFAELIRKNVEPNLKLEVSKFRKLCESSRDSSGLPYVAACAAEQPLDEDQVTVSPLRMVNGSGHQDFLPILKEICDATTVAHIRATLFGPWRYADSGRNRSLRWDPADKREYALRWDDPSTDPATVELAANRLAIEALPLLPTQPGAFRARTTCFQYHPRTKRTFFRWPLWSLQDRDAKSAGVTLDALRCLLDLPQLAEPEKYRPQLRSLGVYIVCEAQRLQDGYYGNFAPATAIPT